MMELLRLTDSEPLIPVLLLFAALYLIWAYHVVSPACSVLGLIFPIIIYFVPSDFWPNFGMGVC